MRIALLPLVLTVASSSLLAQQNYPTPPSGEGFPIYPDGQVIEASPKPVGTPAAKTQTAAVAPASVAPPTLAARIANLERQLQARGQLDLLRQMSEIRNEVSTLQGGMDELQYKVQRLEQRQRDLFKDLDQRLSRLRGQVSPGANNSTGAGAPLVAPTPVAVATPSSSVGLTPLAPSVQPQPVTVTSPSNTAGDRAAYDKAYQLVSDGKYGEALAALDRYLQQYPKGEFRANAYYWQGQIFYLNRQLAEAEVAYQSVLNQFATHPKAADSMLKLAIVKLDLKQTDLAAKLFNQVIAKYPGSSAARLAKQQLRRLPQ